MSPVIFGVVKAFRAVSYSTRTKMKSTLVVPTCGRPMARRLSGKGTDFIAEQQKFHSPWKVYPPWQYDLLVQNYGVQNVKLIYMVRHAEGWHNVNQDYKSIENMDAKLTPLGKNQCYELRDEILLFNKELGINKTIDSSDTIIERNPGNAIDRRRLGLEH